MLLPERFPYSRLGMQPAILVRRVSVASRVDVLQWQVNVVQRMCEYLIYILVEFVCMYVCIFGYQFSTSEPICLEFSRKIDKSLEKYLGYKSCFQPRQILDYRRRTVPTMWNSTKNLISRTKRKLNLLGNFFFPVTSSIVSRREQQIKLNYVPKITECWSVSDSTFFIYW